VLAEHFELSVRLHGEKQAGRMMRKFGIKFSRHHPRPDAVKDAFIRVQSLDDWRAVLKAFYAGRPVAGDDRGATDPSSPRGAEKLAMKADAPVPCRD
jgi:hypothetical protein